MFLVLSKLLFHCFYFSQVITVISLRQQHRCTRFPTTACTALYTTARNTALVSIAERLQGMSASELKKLLSENGYASATVGMFEKRELVDALLRLEKDALLDPKVDTIALNRVEIAPTKDMLGLCLSKDGANGSYTFVIDTGATINLLRKEVSEKMRGASALQPQYISSFGSVGQIAYTTTRISDCCISNTGMNLGLLDFSVLSHSAALPQKSDGLLGLQFLRSLILDSDYVIEIDFARQVLRRGPRRSILSPLQRARMKEVKSYYLSNGLLAADICVSSSGRESSIPCLVDIGSSYTILNTVAAEKLLGIRTSNMIVSNKILAGIDGKPIATRIVPIDKISSGELDINMKGRTVYATDIPGLVGAFGNDGVCAGILGNDILGHGRLVFDLNRNYLFIEDVY